MAKLSSFGKDGDGGFGMCPTICKFIGLVTPSIELRRGGRDESAHLPITLHQLLL